MLDFFVAIPVLLQAFNSSMLRSHKYIDGVYVDPDQTPVLSGIPQNVASYQGLQYLQ